MMLCFFSVGIGSKKILGWVESCEVWWLCKKASSQHYLTEQKTSSPNNTELKQEQQHITKVLQSNGYSKQFIEKARRQWHLKQQNKNNNQPAEKEPEPDRRINLPYIQGLSEQLQRTLSQHNIKSTFYTATTLRKILPSPKDPIPTEKKHNIIYKLDCKDCDAVYIGESKRAH